MIKTPNDYKQFFISSFVFLFSYFIYTSMTINSVLLSYIPFIYYQLLFSMSMVYIYLSAYYDYKEKEVYDFYTVPVLVLGLLTFNYEIVLLTAGIMVVIRYITGLLFQREAFGEADIIIYSGIAAFFTPYLLIFIYFLSNIIAIIQAYYSKTVLKDEEWKVVPLIPSIFLSILITTHLIHFDLENYLKSFFNL